MLFRSPHDPLNLQANQELIILCHAQERVLVPLPKFYQDVQRVAREEFDLTGDLVFETTDLLGCEEPPVRIHPRSWEGISTVLRTLTVKLAQASAPVPAARPRPSEALSGSRRLSQKRISVANAAPIRLTNGASLNGAAPERQSISTRKGLFASGASRPASIVASTKDLVAIAGPSTTTSSRISASSPPTSHALAPAPSKIEELDDDYEEDDVRVLSPTKKRAARQRVMSDYGLEGDDDEDHPHGGPGGHSDDDGEMDSPLGSRSGRMSRAGSASVIELDGPPTSFTSSARKPETGKASPLRPLDSAPTPEPKIKTEKALPSSSKQPTPPTEPSQPSQPGSSKGPKGDESFLVSIEYSEDPESRSLFKTRGRHMVSKVLMQACRTFGLEEYYHSAQLVLLVEEEDEDGELTFQRRYACGRDETMVEAGAEPNARFIVEIEYDDDD